uniref:Rab-GAP TBC domain-containing protein n=2 Tax=Kalmanozyma brasiliensis (strain GHG001) TaxID=1365824 RepID=V5EM76_KALBG
MDDFASARGHSAQSSEDTDGVPESSAQHPSSIPTQRNWHSLLRVLYLFALLNPSIGYVQGMNEVLFTLLYVFGSAQYPPTASIGITPSSSLQNITADSDGSAYKVWDNDVDLADLTTHAEADAFWCFSALIGEMRELYDFERIEQQSRSVASAERQPSHSGMAGALRRFSLRIKWLDPPLWRNLKSASLDPRLPYYSLRWLACLLSTELSLPSVLRIWDALLAEQESADMAGSAKIEFLIDVCASMMLQIQDRLPHSIDDFDLESEAFSYGMRVLQNYPEGDISPVVEAATLVRQRRLAADLTGDGPPDVSDDDDEEINPRLAAVKARAAQAWRDWTGPRQESPSPSTPVKELPDATPPVTKGGWLVSRARPRPSEPFTEDGDVSIASTADGASSDTSMSSKGTFSGFLAKYAEAVQASDAAANLSKASTNFTARTMARFGDRGSRESTPEASGSPHQMYGSLGRGFPTSPTGSESRFASLGSVSAGFFTRSKRNASESQPHAAGWGSPRTPDITRWSRDTMPDFPLPNVSDSPAGRMEYVDTFGKRISMAPNGRGTSPSSSVTGDDSRERRGSESASSFPLPSMRAAARMGILPQRFREESASPSSTRSAGPKPLLLSQSARPPREGSHSPNLRAADEPSRKVSSGPMAHSMSRGNSHQDGNSVAGSVSGRSSRAASVADSRRSSVADFADLSMPGLSEAGAVPPLPSLTGQSSAAVLPPRPAANTDARIALSSTLQGSVTKDGTVSAGAFARATKSTDAERPEFGHVASSSDVPLVQTTSSISRPRASNRQRTSSSTIDSRTASMSESVLGNLMSNRSSQTTNIVDGADAALGENVVSEEPLNVHKLDASQPGTPASEHFNTTDSPTSQDQIAVRKYTLTDDALPSPTTADSKLVRSKRMVKGRQNSASSVSSRRSLAGLARRNEEPPPSPSLPEVVEDVYGGTTAHTDDYVASPVEAEFERNLSIGEARPASPVRRPSTDRSGFF